MLRSLAVVAATLAPLYSTALAQDSKPAAEKPAVTLKPGDPAPALTVEAWIKGAPVERFEPGRVYVVEFWATWCGPCIASMPHLSALQREYRAQGVTLIGMTSVDKNNPLEAVKKMVAEKGDGMDYSVAWDVERKTNAAFMKAAGQNGIPCSFLIDKQGHVAYIGHPLFLDEPLAGVVAGTWNVANVEAYSALQADYWSWRGKAKKDPKGALAFIAELESKHPKLAHLTTQMKYDAAVAAGDSATARRVAAQLVDEAIAQKNASALNALAWPIVDPDAKVESRDLELALRAAQAAVELTGSKDAAILDTLARVYFWKGDMKRAIELQTQALDVAKEGMRADLQKTLDEYKAKSSS